MKPTQLIVIEWTEKEDDGFSRPCGVSFHLTPQDAEDFIDDQVTSEQRRLGKTTVTPSLRYSDDMSHVALFATVINLDAANADVVQPIIDDLDSPEGREDQGIFAVAYSPAREKVRKLCNEIGANLALVMPRPFVQKVWPWGPNRLKGVVELRDTLTV